ncbi:MAG: hypothetical protein LBP98_07195 [Tannerella sp.]|jgi:hypothetical protein|nr:hypothetical protein [Tannerella sp.]
MREYHFTLYVVVHILFSAGFSSCDLQQEDGNTQERIAGRWQLVKCEYADATHTPCLPEVEADIEFAVTGKTHHCTTPTRRYLYRMDSEFLYLLNRDTGHRCCVNHVQIYKYHLEANRLRLHVFGVFLKSAGRPVSLVYEKKP